MWETRVAPLSGVLFGVLLLASFLVDMNTDFMPPANEVVAYLADSPTTVMVAAYLRLLAAAALIWFGGSLYKALLSDDDGGRLSLLALAGAAVAACLTAAGSVAIFAAAERVSVTGSIGADAAAALFDLAGIATGNGAPVGYAVMIGATGLVMLRNTARPAWIGWSSVILGLALLSPYAWAVLVLVLVWVVVAGAWIYRVEAERAEPARVG